MTQYLQAVKELHSKSATLFQNTPIGASESELGELRESLDFDLPSAYEEFLSWLGRSDGKIFGDGIRISISDIETNSVSLQELLEVNECLSILPKKYVVFWGDEGSIYAWFELPKEGDNPPVYSLSLHEEITQECLTKHTSLADFLLGKLNEFIIYLQGISMEHDDKLPVDLVTIKKYTSDAEAKIATDFLKERGIDAYCVGQYSAGLGIAILGEIELKVSENDEQNAVEVLKGHHSK